MHVLINGAAAGNARLPATAAPQDDLTSYLLNIWAPARDWRAHLGWHWPEDQPPPDDAPLEASLGYWNCARKGEPSDAVRVRLDRAVLADLSLARKAALVRVVTLTDAMREHLLAAHASWIPTEPEQHEHQELEVQLALRGLLLPKLKQLVLEGHPEAVFRHPDEPAQWMHALARHHFGEAEPILKQVPDTSEHAVVASRLRWQLAHTRGEQPTAADVKFVRDEEAALRLHDAPDVTAAVREALAGDGKGVRLALAENPARYLPAILESVDDPAFAPVVVRKVLYDGDWIVQETALPREVELSLLRAVLPWLIQPHDEVSRNIIVEQLQQTPLPEAAHALEQLVRSGDRELAVAAAAALGVMDHRVDLEPLKRRFRTLGAEQDEAQVLVLHDAVQPQEIADGIWLAAQRRLRNEEGTAYDWRLRRLEYIGDVYTGGEPFWAWEKTAIAAKLAHRTPSPQVIGLLEQRLTQRRDPVGVARMVVWMLAGWDEPAAAQVALRHGCGALLCEATLHRIFDERGRFAQQAAAVLEEFRNRGGPHAALAIVVQNDREAAMSTLRDGSEADRAAVLAAARLVRMEFPVEVVAPMLHSEDRTLAIAADFYLNALDTIEAREAIWAAFPDQMRVLGPFGSRGFPGVKDDAFFTRKEPPKEYPLSSYSQATRAQQMLRDDATIEHLVQVGGGSFVFRQRGAERIIYDGEAFRNEPIPPADAQRMLDFITSDRVRNLPPLHGDFFAHVCFPASFLHVHRRGGYIRTLPFARNSPAEFTIYRELELLGER